MKRFQLLLQASRVRSLLSASLVAAVIFGSLGANAAPATKAAASAKKKKGAGPKEAAPTVAPPPPAAVSTKSLEEKLKKEEAAEEPSRLAPAALPPRGGEVSKDEKADLARDAEIESIKKVLPKQKDPNIKAQLLFKLGELWWEKSRFVYTTQEMKAFEAEAEKWHACMKEKTVKECGGEPVPNTRKSELYRANAVDLYRQIITTYPKYARIDEIRFILAYNLADMATGTRVEKVKQKYLTEAVGIYQNLIALNPNSDFVSDAYVELCNYYFDAKPADLNRAELACQAAIKKHKPRTETYATYKMAWIRYNQGQYGEKDEPKKGDMGSVGYLKTVIDMSEKNSKDNAGGLKLKTEALRDLVKSFAKNGERDSAIKYFVEKAGREGSKKLIISLAGEFFTAGGAQYDDAIKTYGWLLTENSLDIHAPEWQAKIVLCYDKKGNRPKVREESQRLVERYGLGTAWCQAQSKEGCERTQEIAEEALYGLVTDYHQEAIKTHSVATYKLARDIYKEYVDHFPKSERAYQMRFYYAEILYALEEYQPAFDQYVKVADDDKEKQLRTVAARNMLLAAEKLVRIETGDYTILLNDDSKTIDETKSKGGVAETHIKAKVDKSKEKQELTKLEKQLVAACDHYTELVPNAEDESAVRLRSAVIFFDKYQYVEAADRFAVIIQKWPEDPTSRVAASLVLESLESKEEWDALNKRAREFAANKKLLEGEAKLKKDEFSKKLQVYIEGATFKLAELLKGKDDMRAGELFTTYLKEFPKSKFAPIAGYNAFQLDQKTKHLDWAIEVGEKMLKDYGVKGTPLYADSDDMRNLPGAEGGKPRDLLLADLTFWLAKTYELTADFDKAAALYEQYVKDYEKDTVALAFNAVPDAQFNAALWYKGLGQDDKAIAAFQKYIDIYKKLPQAKRDEKDDKGQPKLVPENVVAWTIVQFSESQKKWEDFITKTTKYLQAYPKEPAWQRLNAQYHQFLAFKELGNEKQMTAMAEIIGGTNGTGGVYGSLTAEEKLRDTTKAAMAHTQFFLREPEFERYTALRFRSVQTLKADLKAMQDAQKALVGKYTMVVAYGNGDWAIAALVRIGVMPRLFANALRQSKCPKYLDKDQCEMYVAQLEDKALEIETPAVDLLLTAMRKSYELGIYNEWTLKAQSELAEFKPELIGKTYELPLKGSSFFFTADDKPAAPKKDEPKPAEAPKDKAAQAGSGGGVQ